MAVTAREACAVTAQQITAAVNQGTPTNEQIIELVSRNVTLGNQSVLNEKN